MYTQTPKSLQCLRLTAIPNLNARHDPGPGTDLAKPLSPLETLRLTSYRGSVSNGFFSLIHNGTPVSYSPFCQEQRNPEVPPTLLPFPFLHGTPPTTGPEKSQPKKKIQQQAETITSKNQQQLPQRQQEESSKSKNGTAEAPVHNLNAASGIDKYWTICHKVCVIATGGKKRGPKRGQNEVRIMAHSYTYGIHNLSIRSEKAGAQCRSCKTKQPTMPNILRQQP